MGRILLKCGRRLLAARARHLAARASNGVPSRRERGPCPTARVGSTVGTKKGQCRLGKKSCYERRTARAHHPRAARRGLDRRPVDRRDRRSPPARPCPPPPPPPRPHTHRPPH